MFSRFPKLPTKSLSGLFLKPKMRPISFFIDYKQEKTKFNFDYITTCIINKDYDVLHSYIQMPEYKEITRNSLYFSYICKYNQINMYKFIDVIKFDDELINSILLFANSCGQLYIDTDYITINGYHFINGNVNYIYLLKKIHELEIFPLNEKELFIISNNKELIMC